MNSKEFSQIRKLFGKIQKQLAEQLCISLKAIQSYEQGWRSIPSYHEQQILFLLSLKNSSNGNENSCWELTDCPDKWKENCMAWELRSRHFCWLINGTFCQGKENTNWEEKIKICRECKVLKLKVKDFHNS